MQDRHLECNLSVLYFLCGLIINFIKYICLQFTNNHYSASLLSREIDSQIWINKLIRKRFHLPIIVNF